MIIVRGMLPKKDHINTHTFFQSFKRDWSFFTFFELIFGTRLFLLSEEALLVASPLPTLIKSGTNRSLRTFFYLVCVNVLQDFLNVRYFVIICGFC